MIYVPSTIIPGTRALLVGEGPGSTEVQEGRNFAGAAGFELDGQLKDAGLLRSEFSVANVLRHRPPDNDEEAFATPNKAKALRLGLEYDPRYKMFLAPWVRDHIATLKEEVDRLQPNVIVPLGNLSLRVLAGETGITNWRGSVMESYWRREDGKPFKVIPVIHPAAIFRQYSYRISSVFDFCRVKREMNSPHIPLPQYVFTPEPSYVEADVYLKRIETRLGEGTVRLSVDIETGRQQISCIGIAVSDLEAICFPFFDPRRDGCSYWPENEETEIVYRISRILDHPNTYLIGQNWASYDKIYTARRWGVWAKCHFDTGVAHHILWPAAPKKLGFLSSWYCKYHRYWKDEGRGKEEKKEWGAKVDQRTLWTYNCKDCVITYDIADTLERMLDAEGMRPQFEFYMRLQEPTSLFGLKGARIDIAKKHSMKRELQGEVERMQKSLDLMAGHPLMASSHVQLKKFFYDDLQLSVQWDKKGKNKHANGGKGMPTVNEDALHKLARIQPIVKPLTDSITNIRRANVYISGYLSCETPGERIYTSYDVAGTASLRFASRKDPFSYGTNLQNRPKGTGKIARMVREASLSLREVADRMGKGPEGYDKIFRRAEIDQEDGLINITGTYPDVTFHYQLWLPNVAEMFIPDASMLIGDFDLERADIQVMAWEAGAIKLKQMLRERVDLHTENAKVLRSTRDAAKIAAHAFDYMASDGAVARNAGVTTHEASQMRARWFGEHPEIARWQARTRETLLRTGGVRNKFGFRVTFFDRLEQCLPEALAWVPSSTVAVIINTVLLRVHDHPYIEFLMQTHDSLTVQAPLDKEMDGTKDMLEMSRVVVPYDDPLVIPVSGKWSRVSLAECKGD